MQMNVRIGSRHLDVPIIQGGMGVGVSLSSLAGAVMAQSGMGVLSAAHPGWKKPDFWKNAMACNMQAIAEEAEKARSLSGGRGLLGLNVMMALSHAREYVQAGCQAGVDALICGAGLPLELPAWTSGYDVLLAPVVSSARACRLICSRWKKRYDRLPDFVVVEGPMAGGHLGFDREDLLAGTCQPLEDIVEEVIEVLKTFSDQPIPVFAAGGIYTREDIERLQRHGAAGVQMATRFIATRECDASARFKQAFLDCTEDDLKIVNSPAGYPGRAIDMHNGLGTGGSPRQDIRCTGCLKGCSPDKAVYCISRALIDSVSGNPQCGLVFAGANAWRLKEIVSVEMLMNELTGKEGVFQ